ncbi:glycoside hydrolase family 3 protein [Clostridium sp. C2-6-12]|uniref:glycoside hydrolase family 3 protein n=1 Tax=Clostridium sp. C2-6-12 TaxID=2698832 RepID=UPI00136B5D29|nr:glycoside hydrolase family 3 protein [Clostridium sp. C2-6-12]
MTNLYQNSVYPYLNTNIPLKERINDLISRMTLEEKLLLLPTHQEAVPRLNIPEYNVGGEAAHGVVTKLGNATVFPQPIGLSSTWNEDLLKEIGNVIGDEARIYYEIANEKGGLTLWAPTIDMERDPRWGRTEEAYGEDPYLTGKLSSNLVKGMQGNDPFYLKLVPAPKHFYANNHEDGRVMDSSSVDPRNKNEYYLKAFKPAFTEGKAYSMMTAYNEINGTPCILNKEVNDIVKGQWGCDGFVVCDGGDMSQTVEFHKYYKTHVETIAEGLKSGVDCFTDDAKLVINSAIEALGRGLLTENDIDNALRNIFKVRFRLGQFDPKESNPYANIPKAKLFSKEHNALALKAAKEALVLLKNENNFLPLNKDKIKKAAVIGPLSDVVYKDWYTGNAPYKITPLDGIIEILKDKEVIHIPAYDEVIISSKDNNNTLQVSNDAVNIVSINDSCSNKDNIFELTDWGFGSYTLRSKKNGKYLTTDDEKIYCSSPEVFGWFVREIFDLDPYSDGSINLKTWNGKHVIPSEDGSNSLEVVEKADDNDNSKFVVNTVSSGIEAAVKAAQESDIAIVFVVNNPLINAKEEIDRKDLILPPSQQELIKAVYEVNPNTVVVIIGSYPFAVNWEDENIPAILYSAHGCQEIGSAISAALFGNYSPAGRLSMTWYKSVNDLPPIKDYDIIKGKRTYMYFDKEPLYPFGHGLSYTNFHYDNLKLSAKTATPNDKVEITFTVKNIGNMVSDEVVQLYVHSENSRVIRPLKELKGFKRINLNPNEVKEISLTLNVNELSFWDVTQNKFTLEKGSYNIMIGSSSEDIRVKDTLFIDGEVIPPRDLTKITRAEDYDDYNNVILHECKAGGTCVCPTAENSWICFRDVNLKQSTAFEFNTACVNDNSEIEIFLDDLNKSRLAKFSVTNTRDNQKWISQTVPIVSLSGIHDIYLKFSGNFKLSWFKFI